MDTNDPKVHFIYNERWQRIATYRQANGSSVDTHPRDAGRPRREHFVNHAAGLAEYGSSSYIDGVILRDDHEDDWTEAADSTMERRVYYCQNWRADVVALLAENGRIVERAWYEPYGTPHGLNPGDFGGTSSSGDDHYLVPDGDSDADDGTTYLALFGASNALSDTPGSSDPGDGEYGRPNGVIDSDDYFYFLDRAGDAAALGRNVLSAGHDGATASHGTGNLRNRKGLAGYEWDPHVRRYHVRNRVLYPETGRWTRRDPLGYVDGMGLYGYVNQMPLWSIDPSGLFAQDVPGFICLAPCLGCASGAQNAIQRCLGAFRLSTFNSILSCILAVEGVSGGPCFSCFLCLHGIDPDDVDVLDVRTLLGCRAICNDACREVPGNIGNGLCMQGCMRRCSLGPADGGLSQCLSECSRWVIPRDPIERAQCESGCKSIHWSNDGVWVPIRNPGPSDVDYCWAGCQSFKWDILEFQLDDALDRCAGLPGAELSECLRDYLDDRRDEWEGPYLECIQNCALGREPALTIPMAASGLAARSGRGVSCQ